MLLQSQVIFPEHWAVISTAGHLDRNSWEQKILNPDTVIKCIQRLPAELGRVKHVLGEFRGLWTALGSWSCLGLAGRKCWALGILSSAVCLRGSCMPRFHLGADTSAQFHCSLTIILIKTVLVWHVCASTLLKSPFKKVTSSYNLILYIWQTVNTFSFESGFTCIKILFFVHCNLQIIVLFKRKLSCKS